MEFRTDVYGLGHSFERTLEYSRLVPFLQRWEGFKAKRYIDGIRGKETAAGPAGSPVYSIGYGHAEDGDNAPFVIPEDMELTVEQAVEILKTDMARKAHFIDVRVKVPITTYQFSALTSLAFQYGNGRLERDTKVFELLNEGNHIDASCAMLDLITDKNGKVLRGLRVRRACEVEMFVTQVIK